MGAGQSNESRAVGASAEEMSRTLAHRFATKCFTPLELTHLKDNFDSHALDEGGIRYWNEQILSDFLGIPDGAGRGAAGSDRIDSHSLDAGPVLFRMVSYLGAFPFQNTQAPTALTFDAMVKVIVLLTERYGRVLRRGRKDRLKLLFGSLADVGRRNVPLEKQEKKDSDPIGEHRLPSHAVIGTTSHATGFSVDLPANDNEDEVRGGGDDDDDDDDDLALAALESLDAVEVFKHDQRVDRSMYEARISHDTFRRLLMLLLVVAPLRPTSTVSKLTTGQSAEAREALSRQVDSILAAFQSPGDTGISYRTFSSVISTSLPFLFDPLTPLFEHLLFSKNLDLARKRNESDEKGAAAPMTTPPPSPPLTPIPLPGSFESVILNSTLFAHLSFFLATASPVANLNLFRNGTRLHPVYSSAAHGESLTSFSHHVLTWKAPSILLLTGSNTSSSQQETVIVGAYLPQAWKPPSSSFSCDRPSPKSNDPSTLPCLFQLLPTHTVLRGNPSRSALKPNLPVASFSTKTGIALGCNVPPSSRTSSTEHLPTPTGGGSLLIDSALENATFVVSDGLNGEGVFLPPSSPFAPHPHSSSSSSFSSSRSSPGTRKTAISIYNLEVWGIVHDPSSEQGSPAANAAESSTAPLDAIAQQRQHWEFEAREAERRRNIYLNVGGGDSEQQSGRALLEMAGIIGDSKYTHGSRHR
ncbi:hypothetical protein VTO42DRAFT_4911 [Malbranchea cinnamomea]